MVRPRPQLALRRGRDRPRAARRRRARGLRGQDPHVATPAAPRTRRSRPRSSSGSSGWRPAGPRRTTSVPPEMRIDLVAVHPTAARPLRRRPRAGARLMALATAHTVSLHGALGHLIDVQADVSPGSSRHDAGRPARRVAQRGPRPLPDGDHQQPVRLAGAPGGSRSCSSPADLLKRGTHFDLAIALAVLAACGDVAAAVARPARCSSASSPSTGGLRSVPGVLPMVMAASRRGIRAGDRARAAGARGRDGAGHDGARHALAGPGASPSSAARRCPEAPPVAPMSGQPAARVARRAAARASIDLADLDGHGRRQVRRSRSPRPAATTCCSSGPKGVGQDLAGRAAPGHPARPLASRSRSS